MVKLAVLTSSRADFGVYLPLLKAFKQDNEIYFDLIVFGTHLSHLHGYTIKEILSHGFENIVSIPTTLSSDDPESISTSAALTNLKFSSFWALNKSRYDFILCLGDRYEMFSAAVASVPFRIPVVHFYGGDYTVGAIDNVYRDGITHLASIHFTSTEKCTTRVKKMVTENTRVYPIGILSLDSISKMKTLTTVEFYENWNIDITLPFVLITFHPETMNISESLMHCEVISKTLQHLHKKYQLVVTMPNADTNNNAFRDLFVRLKSVFTEKFYAIENFGQESYFTALKYCSFVLGNSSSGISEAASFGKYVINVGSRQKGRETGDNIYNVEFNSNQIIDTVKKIEAMGDYSGNNIYYVENSIPQIIKTLKDYERSK